ncbi:hypothetical protein SEA_FRANCOB_7 [Streptomyces phage Francob]
MVESNIKVIAQKGKFTLAEVREFVEASDYLMKNAVVEVGLDSEGRLEMSVKEGVLRQF